MEHYSSRTAEQEIGGAPWLPAQHAVDDYAWDVQGFLHLPAARAADSAAVLHRIIGPGAEVREASQLPEHGNVAVGSGFTDFVRPSAAVLCAGVTVIANRSAGGPFVVTLVAGSHKSLVAVPPRSQNLLTEVATTCVLETGDVLLVAAETHMRCTELSSLSVRHYHRVSTSTAAPALAPEVAAGWFPSPPKVAAVDPDVTAHADPQELWFWDLRGYLVIRGLMDKDWLDAANATVDKWIADSSTGFDSSSDESQVELGGGAAPGTIILSREEVLRSNGDVWPAETSPRLKGHGAQEDPLVLPRRRMGGLYQLPGTDGEPFRRMLEHPEIVRRLDWMLGRGWHEVQAPTPDPPMLCSYPPGEQRLLCKRLLLKTHTKLNACTANSYKTCLLVRSRNGCQLSSRYNWREYTCVWTNDCTCAER
eukprot:COSAG06_NODE_2578_length_6622_cov_18.934386_1_plen_421_part_00